MLIKYGTKITMETKEEAIERVYNRLKDDARYYGHYSFRTNRNRHNEHRIYLTGENKLSVNITYDEECKGEAKEVIDAVEERIIKELQEQKAAEEARRKAEAEAERIRQDEAKKAKYLAWKAEAERLDIPFRDLCDMKRAEMEEMLDDDWD